MFTEALVRRAVLTLGFSLSLLTGCAADPNLDSELEGKVDLALEDESVDVGEKSFAVLNGWTPYTSEEYAPISCSGSGIFKAVQCSGAYCDNIRAYCGSTAGTRGSTTWTSYFSEEGTNYRFCAANQWVTGLACRGKYCDEVALQCSAFTGVTPSACVWTGWISEEGGGYLDFGAGYFARGMQCSGAYCDSKRWYVCRL